MQWYAKTKSRYNTILATLSVQIHYKTCYSKYSINHSCLHNGHRYLTTRNAHIFTASSSSHYCPLCCDLADQVGTSWIMRSDICIKHSRQTVWTLVLPFDTKNPYRLSKLIYRSIIDISTSWHLISAIVPVVYRVGDNWRTVKSMGRQIHTILVRWEQNMRAKHCYVDLSSWYELWFAIICFDMNVTSALSTAIQQFRDGFDSK